MSAAGPAFVIDPFVPAYLVPANRARLADKVTAALEGLRRCRACPRCCEVNRTDNQTGVCGTGRHAIVASAGPHYGEEACLVGRHGSGTIFFSMCNLRCVFCQNWDISQQGAGRVMTARQIAALALDLQAAGCHNVNFVTPEHVVPQTIEAIAEAVEMGLRIPIVYNTSAYDSVESLRLLEGLVDIYMPDFKFWSPGNCRKYLGARLYSAYAREAIAEMHRQVGVLKIGPDGIARRGLLVRHLVVPGLLGDSAEIFHWLAREISPDTFVNIMGQYHPDNQVGRTVRTARGNTVRYPELNRRPTVEEIRAAYAAAREAGLWRFDEPCP